MNHVLYRIHQHSFVAHPHQSEIYSHATEETDQKRICEELFAAWNAGSGRECAAFLSENKKRNIHSMSVPDVIAFLNDKGEVLTYWQCDNMGWSILTRAQYMRARLLCMVRASRSYPATV